jgi:hypothetical protein
MDSITNTSSGQILGNLWFGIHNNNGTIGNIQNNGTITGGSSGGAGIRIQGGQVTGNINNTGTINGTSNGGIWNDGGNILGTINNSGVVTGTTYSLQNTGTIAGGVINSGTFDGALALGSANLDINGNSARIIGNTTSTATANVNGTFTSEGTFSVNKFNVTNGGSFIMNNDVTVSGAGALFSNAGQVTVGATGNRSITGNYSQSGVYTIGITNPSTYGKLTVSGSAAFSNGYSFSLVSNSTVAVGTTYTQILTANSVTGFTRQSYAQNLGGMAYRYSVFADPNHSNWLNLVIDSVLSTTNTTRAVEINANGLATIYNQQTAAYQAALSYDCQVYDEHGLCVSAGGRYTYAGPAPSTNAQAGLVVVGYRPAQTFRVGAFVDQSVNISTPSGFSQSKTSPMWGLFAKWHQNKDETGFGVQASAVTSESSLNVSRTQLQNTEQGSGTTQLNGQGYQLTTNYHQPITNATALVPYLGLRYIRVNAGAYAENTTATVTSPLSYNAMAQSTFSAIGGIGVRSLLAEKLTGTASVGIQQNLNYSMANYQGTSNIAGFENFSLQMPRSVNSMATASVGMFYDVNKRERLGLNVLWQQQPFIATNTTTALATYTIGF